MGKFNFDELGITIDNIDDAVKSLADYKKELKSAVKATAKANKATAIATAIDNANAFIEDGTLKAGTDIVIMYNKEEVTVTVKNTPKKDQANIGVVGDALKNKNKFIYAPKGAFVRIA